MWSTRNLVQLYTLHKSYEFSHLHLQINKESKSTQALLFKLRVQFRLTDSEEIFFATCAFNINCRMWTSNPGHGVNCIRCYHQSLSVVATCLINLPEPGSCSRLDCAVSPSHSSPLKVLCDEPWKASLTDLLCTPTFQFIWSRKQQLLWLIAVIVTEEINWRYVLAPWAAWLWGRLSVWSIWIY